MKLFYRKYGKGKPIIITHGLFGMSDNWIPIAKKLATKFKVFIPDMRNHGQSPHNKTHTYKAMSNDLFEFMEDAKINNATLIGHSMGGKAIMQFASDFPEKTNKMIILDISPREYLHDVDFYKRTTKHKEILQRMQAFELKKVNSRKKISEYFREFFKDDFIIQLIQKNITKNNEKQFVWKLNTETLLNNLNEINKEIKFKKRQNIKSLFVFGSHSPYLKNADKGLIKENYPCAKIKLIKHAGHMLHIEQEKELVKTILDFVNQIR